MILNGVRRFHMPNACMVYRILSCLIIIILIGQPGPGAVLAQDRSPVLALFESMSVEEKVGQLFLVPFVGNDTGPEAEITTLITQYKVGGAVLQASNSNFKNNAATPQEVARLTNALQAHTLANKNIPLFIAIDQEGDGWPYTRITGGVTEVPGQMSIGATWNPDHAKAVGNIVGREISAMGVNLLLGPVLDVLNDPRPTGRGDIGTRTFGGDPFWVGEMGKAYIQGIHEGSNHTVATVAKHFPGHGGSDRLPDSEVATVDKSLQELKRIELSPFFAVTTPETSTDTGSSVLTPQSGMTDAMMSSHIRYRGLQGDIRQFTAPISFDVQGMRTLLQLPEFAAWRNQGGLIISDALGVPAVRKHYDPTQQSFPHRRIAREAFLAGNDVLILGQFALRSIWSEEFENIKDTIEYFQTEYRNDPVFAARVDEAVIRILQLKLKLFPNPSPNAMFVDGEVALAISGQGQDTVNRIARDSLTLLHPSPNEYKRRLERPPTPDENILIISDVRQVQECFQENCGLIEPLPYNAIEEIILKQYGPEGTRQVLPENVASMSFAELKQVLVGSLAQVNQPAEAETIRRAEFRSPEEVTALIQEADWIIFAMLDLNTSRYPDSDTLKLFLAQGINSPDKKLIGLALNSPYYLDTTEINKLTAYLGLYSKTTPHLEVAIRALFDEAIFGGASPVTVDGLSYDLPEILAPDPIRSFPLQVQQVVTSNHDLPVSVTLRAGLILDHNGNPVPDGTPVSFQVTYRGGQSINVPLAHTVNGQAETAISLSEPGLVEISANSGQATSQRPQFVNISAPPQAAAETTTVTPTTTATPQPTSTASPQPTDTVMPTASPSPAPTPTPRSDPILLPPEAGPFLSNTTVVKSLDLFATLLTIALTTITSLVVWRKTYRTLGERTRLMLVVFIGGLIGYLLYGIGWLRPDLWFKLETTQLAQRLMLLLLVFSFGILGQVIERQTSR